MHKFCNSTIEKMHFYVYIHMHISLYILRVVCNDIFLLLLIFSSKWWNWDKGSIFFDFIHLCNNCINTTWIWCSYFNILLGLTCYNYVQDFYNYSSVKLFYWFLFCFCFCHILMCYIHFVKFVGVFCLFITKQFMWHSNFLLFKR